jgi:hypothetical protein
MWLQGMPHVFCGNMRFAYPLLLGTFVIFYLEAPDIHEYSSKKKTEGILWILEGVESLLV